MPYLRVSIATWKIDLQGAEGQAIIQKSREEGLPLLRRQPGFIRYQGTITGPRTSLQVFEWESEAQALAGAQRFTEWFQGSGAGQQLDSLDVHLGEVIVSS
jgi:hypothetical protein